MKKLATLLFLLLFALHIAAQSERFPFVQEGKTWIVQHGQHWQYDDINSMRLEVFTLRGDTTIQGITGKKMLAWEYSSTSDKHQTRYVAVFYEANQKVYICQPDSQSYHLLFDASLQVGDSTWLGAGHTDTSFYDNELIPRTAHIRISQISPWEKDAQRNVYWLEPLEQRKENDETSPPYYPVDTRYWIEGIGAPNEPHLLWEPGGKTGGKTSRLLTCFVADRTDFVLSIDHLKVVPTHRKGMFGIDGRRLNNLPERGVYILDGQKMVR